MAKEQSEVQEPVPILEPALTLDIDPDLDLVDDETEEGPIPLEAVVLSYLDLVPQPTDEQIHSLAGLLGVPYPEFEELMFKMLGEEVEELDVVDLPLEEVEDPLDGFILCYFARNPAPSEEQVHSLAEILEISPEELEQRVYAMLSALTEDDEESDLVDDPEDLDVLNEMESTLPDVDTQIFESARLRLKTALSGE